MQEKTDLDGVKKIAKQGLWTYLNYIVSTDTNYQKPRFGIYQWKPNESNSLENDSMEKHDNIGGDLSKMKKRDFIKKCFEKLLSDGYPHTYKELLAYTWEMAKGTAFEGRIGYETLSSNYKSILKRNPLYEKIQRGTYMLKSGGQGKEVAEKEIKSSQAENRAEGMNPILKEHFLKIESLVNGLQKEMKESFITMR